MCDFDSPQGKSIYLPRLIDGTLKLGKIEKSLCFKGDEDYGIDNGKYILCLTIKRNELGIKQEIEEKVSLILELPQIQRVVSSLWEGLLEEDPKKAREEFKKAFSFD